MNDTIPQAGKQGQAFIDKALAKDSYLANIKSVFVDWLEKVGVSENLSEYIYIASFLVAIIVLALVADLVTKKLVINMIKKLVSKSKTSWDDILLRRKVFHRLSHFAPALIIYLLVPVALVSFPKLVAFIHGAIFIYLLVMVLLSLDALISGFHDIYLTLPISRGRSIKSYVQVLKIILFFIGGMIILSVLINKDVGKIFAGLGALAAVLILVFKDSILGLVGSVQLSANDMVRVGDWIQMPDRNADGDVIEISLNTIKVQNWDKTISTIPTYALITESFYNWRGMKESGGRRIKRHILIDMSSIKFCTPDMLKKLEKVIYLKDYLDKAREDIKKYNEENKIDESIVVNGRRLTNVGVFRKYLEFYLKNKPEINKDLTFLVRQLQPTEKGLPIEIYIFTKTTVWGEYEAIQADIFDHILSVIKEFELTAYQSPSGEDFKRLGN